MSHLRGIKVMGLALVAMLAFAAFAASASASEPKAELESGAFPVTFTGSGGLGVLEVLPTPTRIVHCTANTSSGEISSATTAKKVKVIFKGCTSTGPFGIKVNCSSSGAATGEIVSFLLKGLIVYIKAGTSDTGIDLEPESGTEFAKFTCGGGIETLSVTGTVVGVLTPVNSAFTTAFTLTFAQKEGHQIPEGYLANTGCGFVKDVLNTAGSGFESFSKQSAVEGTETLTTSKKMKVTASKCV
jgi:hypothetical protein